MHHPPRSVCILIDAAYISRFTIGWIGAIMGDRPDQLQTIIDSRPIGFRIFRRRSRSRSRVHRYVFPSLPLEQERFDHDVLAHIVEFDRSLDTVKGIARMQFGDDLGIVEALDLLHNLLHDLPDRITLGYVAVDPIGGAALLGEIRLHKLGISRNGRCRVPGVRHHDPFR